MAEKKTVLFIDDNKDFLTLTAEELESDQFELKTIHVTPSVEVLEAVRLAKPDLIFLDVLFSKKFSNSLAVQIRSEAELKDIPVYLMSFLDLAEIEAIADKKFVNGCFMKPVKPSDLNRLFETHFGIRLNLEDA